MRANRGRVMRDPGRPLRAVLATACGVLVLALTACSAAGVRVVSLPPSPAYTPVDRSGPAKSVERCMQKHHIAATYHPREDAFDLTAPESIPHARVAALLRECEKAAHFPQNTTLTKLQIEYLYFKDVELYNCLTRHGVHLPEPPSREAFARTLRSQPYVPYSYMSGLAPSAVARLMKQCPQPNV